MAQKVITSFIDDLDGIEAEGTVIFGLDGQEYEIDLATANAAKLRKALAPFVTAARPANRRANRRDAIGRGRTNRKDSALMRDWLKFHGHEVKAQGRIPTTLQALVPNPIPARQTWTPPQPHETPAAEHAAVTAVPFSGEQDGTASAAKTPRTRKSASNSR
jgi:hypothetical protein